MRLSPSLTQTGSSSGEWVSAFGTCTGQKTARFGARQSTETDRLRFRFPTKTRVFEKNERQIWSLGSAPLGSNCWGENSVTGKAIYDSASIGHRFRAEAKQRIAGRASGRTSLRGKTLWLVVRSVVHAAQQLADGEEICDEVLPKWRLKKMRGAIRLDATQLEELEDWIVTKHSIAELVGSQLFKIETCDKEYAHVRYVEHSNVQKATRLVMSGSSQSVTVGLCLRT